jgi:MOSC domain-containing protein YiiM
VEIDLNVLAGREFTVGSVRCRGVELCEACAHLQSVTQPGVLAGLVHRGGLRAEVLTDGEVAVGDAVVSAA